MATIYLLRHGEAESGGNMSDAQRGLTELGQQQLFAAGKVIHAWQISWQTIWCSPLRRAQQTADIVQHLIEPKIAIETKQLLAPGGDAECTVGALQETCGLRDTLLMVGHMPDLANLASLLVFGQPTSGFQLLPGGMICLGFRGSVRVGLGLIQWLMPPHAWQTFSG